AGTRLMTFTVTLSRAPTAKVTMVVDTLDGTGRQPRDYRAVANRTITFTPGQRTAVVTVAIVGDRAREPSETFRVRLSRPIGATLARSQGVGTITNDD
ncbi:MAG: hypothetical protein RJA49_2248, partial [Actinomycetota bacterium]